MAGSYFPSAVTSCHSKLWLIESERVTTTSLVSFPVMTKSSANWPVTTHDPAGIGDVAASGFGTVVAFAGACPSAEYAESFSAKAQ
jgi:hypothetical protein